MEIQKRKYNFLFGNVLRYMLKCQLAKSKILIFFYLEYEDICKKS